MLRDKKSSLQATKRKEKVAQSEIQAKKNHHRGLVFKPLKSMGRTASYFRDADPLSMKFSFYRNIILNRFLF